MDVPFISSCYAKESDVKMFTALCLALCVGCSSESSNKPLPYPTRQDCEAVHSLSVTVDGREATIVGGAATRHVRLPEGATIQLVSRFGNGKQMACISHPEGKKILYVCSTSAKAPVPGGGAKIVHRWRDVKVAASLKEDGRGYRLNEDDQLQEEVDSMVDTVHIVDRGWYAVEWCYFEPPSN